MDHDKSFMTKKKVTLDNFEFVNNDYSGGSNLGQGAYGKVHLVRYKGKQRMYAMKLISKKLIAKYGARDYIRREIKL